MIDVSVFIGNFPFRRLAVTTPGELREMLKSEKIDCVLVSSIEGIFYEEPQIANEELFAQLADKFIMPVAVLNPTLANWQRSLLRCREQYQIRAVKLHPNYHHYNLTDVAARNMIKAVGEAGLPVIVQLRIQDIRSHHPLMQIPDVRVTDVIEVAEVLPEVHIVLGGIKWAEATSQAAKIKPLPNLWLDISHIETVDALRRLIDVYGTERILFGTHTPFFYVRSAIIKLNESQLSAEERERITRRNAEKLLGLNRGDRYHNDRS